MSAVEAPRAASVDVDDLRIGLTGTEIDVVDEIAIEIYPGEVLGLVGESGSGKTTVGMALLGHVRGGGRVSGGSIVIDGRDIGTLEEAQLRRLRGGTVSSTRDCVVTSRPVVGSSHTITRGRFANAIAIATRCCWPPESWCG